jgi:flagellum-specific ATP synthase
MTSVAPKEQIHAARRVRQMLAKFNKARDLIQLGAYAPGHDNELDIAVQTQPQITALLQQDMLERAPLQDCQRRLMALAA